jgi:hypothetical protein
MSPDCKGFSALPVPGGPESPPGGPGPGPGTAGAPPPLRTARVILPYSDRMSRFVPPAAAGSLRPGCPPASPRPARTGPCRGHAARRDCRHRGSLLAGGFGQAAAPRAPRDRKGSGGHQGPGMARRIPEDPDTRTRGAECPPFTNAPRRHGWPSVADPNPAPSLFVNPALPGGRSPSPEFLPPSVPDSPAVPRSPTGPARFPVPSLPAGNAASRFTIRAVPPVPEPGRPVGEDMPRRGRAAPGVPAAVCGADG